jgi:prepilin signal peptidase PulO-like enzyme (type II secretory pathway)
MIYAALVVLGLCLGSFVNALVWRLHEQDAIKRRKITPSLRDKLSKLSISHGRSMCPKCGHELAVIDLVPLLSWLLLGGKCRYCHKPISWQYPLVELLTVGLFLFSFCFWPVKISGQEIIVFILWLFILVLLIGLAIYDIRWRLLPNKLVYPLAVLAIVNLTVTVVVNSSPASSVVEAAGWGLLVIGGLFYLLFQLSNGKWIGGGDVKLGAVLGIIVGGPLSSVLLLFLSSVGGTLYALPLIVTGKAQRKTHIPFGPFLILAAIITRLFGQSIINWYKGLYL